MGVALSAAKGQTQPNRAGGIDPIEDRLVAVLVCFDASLFVDHGVAVESACDALTLARGQVTRRIEQVPGELLDGELIEGHIGIDSGDHPIAVGPHDTRAVDGKSIGIRIASLIEPEPPPAFAELRARQEVFDQPIDRV